MFIAPIVLVVLLVVGVGIYQRSSKSQGPLLVEKATPSTDPPPGYERIFLALLSFAGLMAFLYATTGLVALLLLTLTSQSATLLGTSDARTQASYYLAALIVGLPIWLACWTRLQRRVARSPEERNALERRLLLAATFATTSVVGLFGLHSLLQAVLTLPGASDTTGSIRDAVEAGARFLVWGVAWLAYARLGWQERTPRQSDDAHDLAVYMLSGTSLSFLAIGLWQAVRETTGDLATSDHSSLLLGSASSFWNVWGAIASWIITGGAIWAAISQYDVTRRGRRYWRVIYLYLVLVLAVPTALGGAASVLYELLRRIFGYHVPNGNWLFLQDALPPLLIGGAIWVYHWAIVRRQTAPDSAKTAARTGSSGIPWPRRPAIALLALLGTALVVPGFVALVWSGLDAVFGTASVLSVGDWWRDRTSAGIAAALIGSGTWLVAWGILQRVAAKSAEERAALERCRLLGLIVTVGSLTAASFSIAVLWLIFQRLLGATQDTNTLDWVLKDLSAVLVILVVTIYHGQIFRREHRLRSNRTTPPHIVALLTPGAEHALADIRQATGWNIECGGYLSLPEAPAMTTLEALRTQLSALTIQEGGTNALLILAPTGGVLYPYTKGRPRPPVPYSPVASSPARPTPTAEPEGTAISVTPI